MTPTGDRPTITQLAEQLGVSAATVSRAFTRPELLSPQTVTRVRAAAAQAGYVPNRHARALSTGRSAALGIVVPDIANPFFPPLIRHIQNLAQAQGLTVVLADTDERPEREEQIIRSLAHQVEGLVLCSSRLPAPLLRRLATTIRLVLVNRDVPDTMRVLLDTAPAVREAVELLAGYGHRHLAYLAGPQPRSWSNSQRRRAVSQTTEELGLRLTTFTTGAGSYDDAHALTTPVQASGATGVLAFDDTIAHGFMGGCAERGIHIPSEISLIGCDDVLATATHPRLSTIAVDLEAAARATIGLLLDRTERSARQSLTASLILRGTVSSVRMP